MSGGMDGDTRELIQEIPYSMKAKTERKREFYQKAINDLKRGISLSPLLREEFSPYLSEAEEDLRRKF
jgi:hypothetical protein